MSVQLVLNLDSASLDFSGAGIMHLMSIQTKGGRGSRNEKGRNETKWISNKEYNKIFILEEEEKWEKGEADIKIKFLEKKKKQAKCRYLNGW